MKIRNGFVSNSSSSSFIIRDDISIRKLAIEMYSFYLNDRYSNDIEYSEKSIEEFKNNINRLKDENIPIIFQSVNEDTYIYKINNKIFITTCNNVCWNDTLYKYNFSYDDNDDYETVDNFYSPEVDLFIQCFDYCYQCKSNIVIIDNKRYCLKHNKQELNVFQRSSKIKKILE